jgi:hypothetical protein
MRRTLSYNERAALEFRITLVVHGIQNKDNVLLILMIPNSPNLKLPISINHPVQARSQHLLRP